MYDFSFLRSLRKREGLTISDVSERSGISVAVISKLERNQSNAELEMLFRLGRVFGVTATDLLGMAESPLAHVTSESIYASDGFHFRKIRYSKVSCFMGTAQKGAFVKKPEIHHDENEICWVLEGKIRLTLPKETESRNITNNVSAIPGNLGVSFLSVR